MDSTVILALQVAISAINAIVLIYFLTRGLGRRVSDLMDLVDDEESRLGLMKVLSSEFLQVYNYHLMGKASGDSKKLQRATHVLTDAVVHDVGPDLVGGPWSGVMKMILNSEGVRTFLDENDQNLQYLLQAAGPIIKNLNLAEIAGGGLDKPRGSDDVFWLTK